MVQICLIPMFILT